MKKSKIYLSGRVYSQRLKRYIYTYTNGYGEKFQEGTIGETDLAYIPPQVESEECGNITEYLSDPMSITAIRNNCGPNSTTEPVTYSLPAGAYTSIISKDDANHKAAFYLNLQKQDYANEHGICVITYRSIYKSREFTRNNCLPGSKGSTVTITVEANKYSSTISQAHADSLAQAELDAGGQNMANVLGTCSLVYYSDYMVATAEKDNCAEGYKGSTVIYEVPARKYYSNISKEDANAQARADLDSNKQNYANASGSCSLIPIYYNSEMQAVAIRDNCTGGATGSVVIYTVPAGKYSSLISVAAANVLAQADLDANKQTYANTYGTCTTTTTYYSAEVSKSGVKSDCVTGTGSVEVFTIPYGTYTSTISQAAANALALDALEAGYQDYADTEGTCIITTVYYSAELTETIERNNCSTGYEPTSVVYTVEYGKYTSTVSQADADNAAAADMLANKQDYANDFGECLLIYKSLAQTATATKNDCPGGVAGSIVTLSTLAGQFESTVSQAAADALALAWLNANKQVNANTYGTCPVVYKSVARSKTVQKNDCGPYSTGSSVVFTTDANKFTSTISQADADAQAIAWENANSQYFANINGVCSITYYSAQIIGTAQKNNCTEGIGSYVEFIVPYGAFRSSVSQVDADNQATAYFNANKQSFANSTGTCDVLYRSKPITELVSRNNCAGGSSTEPVVFSLHAGAYTSKISQADADLQATTWFNANKQAYANAQGVCTVIVTYYNAAMSRTAVKNNCAPGSKGTSVTYTVAYGTYTSTVSQEDANRKALEDLDANTQAHANTTGTCITTVVYYSKYLSKTLNRNNCGTGYQAEQQTYIVPYGKYSSTTSQVEADILAQNDLDANAQTWVNSNASCKLIYRSKLITESVQKNNCVDAQGSSVTVTNPEGKFTSVVSQADADLQSQIDFNGRKQQIANTEGTCAKIYKSKGISRYYTKSCASGYTAEPTFWFLTVGTYTSTISQADADAQAEAAAAIYGPEYAESVGVCVLIPVYYNVRKSITLTKNNCGTGSTGSSYTYIVDARKYSSNVSQAAADALADADIAANGQYQANLNGTCSVNCNISATFTVVRNGANDVSITVNPVGGVAPYTYLWSTGAITKSISVPPNAEYSVIVKDAKGCLYTDKVKPSFKISGIQIEVMYFKNNTANTADPFYPRIVYGNHECFRARFEVFANNTSLGIANMNNLTPSLDFGEWAKNDKNTPPEPYDNPDPGVNTGGISSGNRDRYWKKVITSSEAEALIKDRVDGKIDITLKWTGENNSINVPVHSDQNWIRIKDSTGKVLLSTTTKAFTNLVFDPFA